ncbi:MAG: SCO family protein [Anaerolineales bacterium]|nr:SCO family protein [Anaerolineales bacterium]
MQKFVILSGIFLLIGLAACSSPEFKGTVMPEPLPVEDFTLIGKDAAAVSLSDFSDKLVLLYFGYTFCPDVCPTSMADLAKVQREMDDAGENIQVVMVSVDPERDTPDKLAEYVEHFHPTFVGLTGTPTEIDKAGERYGLYYEIHEGTEASGYLVDHTARIYVIQDGMYIHSFGFGTPWEDIVNDLEILMK